MDSKQPPDAVKFHDVEAEAFDARYTYDKRFQSRHLVWDELIAAHSAPHQVVLDIGCGGGALTILAAQRNRRVLGIDGSDEMIRLAREKSVRAGVVNATYEVGRLEDLATLVTEPCDLLLCSSVLEYLDDLESALTALAGVLRPGGIAILSMPNRQSFFRKAEPLLFRLTGRPAYYPYVLNVLTLADLEQRMGFRGLALVQSRFYGSTPVLSPVFRPLGLRRWSDTLFAAVFRKA